MKRFMVLFVSIFLVCTLSLSGLAELKKGSKGADVIELQKRLIELGYLDDVVDGFFGNKTKAAVEAFQKNNGLEITGVATIKDTSVLFADYVVPSNGISSDVDNKNAVQSSVAVPRPNEVLPSVSILESTCDLEILEAGWDIVNEFLYYGVRIHNNSDTTVVQYPAFRIVARSADGSLLGTTEQVLNVIYPGEDCFWAGLGFELAEKPTVVEFEVLDPEEWNLSAVSLSADYMHLVVEGISVKKDSVFTNILGEVVNLNDVDINMAAIVCICRDADGKMLAGDIGFVDNVKSGKKVPFSVMAMYCSEEIDSHEVYAYPWL